jgi:hypothetical protein
VAFSGAAAVALHHFYPAIAPGIGSVAGPWAEPSNVSGVVDGSSLLRGARTTAEPLTRKGLFRRSPRATGDIAFEFC